MREYCIEGIRSSATGALSSARPMTAVDDITPYADLGAGLPEGDGRDASLAWAVRSSGGGTFTLVTPHTVRTGRRPAAGGRPTGGHTGVEMSEQDLPLCTSGGGAVAGGPVGLNRPQAK